MVTPWQQHTQRDPADTTGSGGTTGTPQHSAPTAQWRHDGQQLTRSAWVT